MSDKNNINNWELPSIYDIIDRMTLSFIFPPEKKEDKKPRKMKSKKAKVKK